MLSPAPCHPMPGVEFGIRIEQSQHKVFAQLGAQLAFVVERGLRPQNDAFERRIEATTTGS